MLVLSRAPDKDGKERKLVVAFFNEVKKVALVLGRLMVVKVEGDQVRLGFDCPRNLSVHREGTTDAGKCEPWGSIVEQKKREGWTFVDDPALAARVLEGLIDHIPEVIESLERSTDNGDVEPQPQAS